MALKAKALPTLPDGRHTDGPNNYGLAFNVVGNRRNWIQRLVINGKRRNEGLGPYPIVSLREARELAFENARRRHRGEDPFADAKPRRTVPTFAEAAAQYIELQAAGWKTGRNNERNWRSSLTHASALHDMPVDTVTTDHVAGVVPHLVAAGKVPLAKMVRSRIRAIMDWSFAAGHRGEPNPANGTLDPLLPKTTHRASVPHAEIFDVLAKVDAIPEPNWAGMKAAFRFATLTVARTSEGLGMTFGEIDWLTGTWIVPAARMKTGRDHIA